jgi:hypothetical protein
MERTTGYRRAMQLIGASLMRNRRRRPFEPRTLGNGVITS